MRDEDKFNSGNGELVSLHSWKKSKKYCSEIESHRKYLRLLDLGELFRETKAFIYDLSFDEVDRKKLHKGKNFVREYHIRSETGPESLSKGLEEMKSTITRGLDRIDEQKELTDS